MGSGCLGMQRGAVCAHGCPCVRAPLRGGGVGVGVYKKQGGIPVPVSVRLYVKAIQRVVGLRGAWGCSVAEVWVTHASWGGRAAGRGRWGGAARARREPPRFLPALELGLQERRRN